MKVDIYVLNKTETEQMHHVQLNMMIELDQICRKHNINYIIDGGTLLGAARHKGFIPWDDDIDVRMLREDYDKFGSVANLELPDHMFFQNYNTDPKYPWLYGKLRMKGTKAVRIGQDKLQMESGIYIDIFPCDGLPDNIFLKKIHNLIAKMCRKILYARTAKRTTNTLVGKMGWRIVCLIPRQFVYKVTEYLSDKYNVNNCKKVGIIGWHGIEDAEGFLLKYFTQLTELEFEGHLFYAPEDWDNYLKYVFGEDYMEIPPVEKRKMALDFAEFDLGKFVSM